MASELGIVDLLGLFGFDPHLKSKLVRHQDSRYDMSQLIAEGWFDLYQRTQAKPIFHGCDQIVSFIGDGPGRARLVGVYRVLDASPEPTSAVPKKCPYTEWNGKYFYELDRQTEFSGLEGRVIVDWGLGALAWHQHLKNKPVIEVLPKGRALPAFTDYLDFTLTFAELQSLVNNPIAHRDWVASLSAVAGVYLILAQPTGAQYIGSAYGTGGIWSRWSQYAATGHGGNALLKELLSKDPAFPGAFRFSVLQVLPKSTTAPEVIRWEVQYKKKLGSRATGLNAN